MKIVFVIRGYFRKSSNNGYKSVTRFLDKGGEWNGVEGAHQYPNYEAAQTALDFLQEDGIFQIDRLFVKGDA